MILGKESQAVKELSQLHTGRNPTTKTQGRSVQCASYKMGWLILCVNSIRRRGPRLFLVVYGCFWKILAFESVAWLKKIISTNAGGHQPIHWILNILNKREHRQICSLLQPWDTVTPGSQAFGLELGLTLLAPLVHGPTWTELHH